MNRCEYCGKECKYNTCSRSHGAKLRVLNNPTIFGKAIRLALAGHRKATNIRWTKRLIELIPESNKLFTLEQKKLIAKALSSQHRFSYNRGRSAGLHKI